MGEKLPKTPGDWQQLLTAVMARRNVKIDHACAKDAAAAIGHLLKSLPQSVDVEAMARIALAVARSGQRVHIGGQLDVVRTDFSHRLATAQQQELMALLVILTIFRSLAQGVEAGLKWFLREVATRPTATGGLGQMLYQTGWFDGLSIDTLKRIFPASELITADDSLAESGIGRVCWAVGFANDAPMPWVSSLFEAFFLPILLGWAAADRMDRALNLEGFLYGAWLKRDEREEHYDYSFSRWAPQMRAAGQRLATRLPPLQSSPHSRPPVVGFFIHSASMLAHVEVLLTALTGIQRQPTRMITPRLYVFSGRHQEMEAAFTAIGVQMVLIDAETPSLRGNVDRLLWLRQRLRDDKVDMLVWVCLQMMLAFASGIGMAPRQVWWSMKFHPTTFEGLDGYITGHSGLLRFVKIMGRQWRAVPECSNALFDPTAAESAASIRKQLGEFDLVCATLSREEKIANPEFLDVVVRLLKANPRLVWLYTGRVDHPLIGQTLAAAGIANQGRFIGWVDTRVYAQVLDFFIDTWPLGSGLTMMQAMAAGRPYVFKRRAADAVGVCNMLETFAAEAMDGPTDRAEDVARLRALFDLDGDSRMLGASGPDDYVAMVQRLIDDCTWRRLCGETARTYANEFLSNGDRTGAMLVEHLQDIMRQPTAPQ